MNEKEKKLIELCNKKIIKTKERIIEKLEATVDKKMGIYDLGNKLNAGSGLHLFRDFALDELVEEGRVQIDKIGNTNWVSLL